MKTWANYAERGRTALLERDGVTLARVIDANFDLRAKLYHIARENLEMIETARAQGASANFAGSGGAIVGTYDDESMYQRIEDAMRRIGVGVIKPVVQAER
jgi:glucuronokinase